MHQINADALQKDNVARPMFVVDALSRGKFGDLAQDESSVCFGNVLFTLQPVRHFLNPRHAATIVLLQVFAGDKKRWGQSKLLGDGVTAVIAVESFSNFTLTGSVV